MPELIASKAVRARKTHRCRCCDSIAIHPGEIYDRDTFVYDGQIYDWVTCKPCAAITDAVFDWAGSPYDEGIGADSYREWANDCRDDPTHGEAARAYLNRANRATR